MIQALEAFETERLKARRLIEADFFILHAMNQNTKVMATLGGTCDEEETKKRLIWNLDQWTKNGFGLWMLFEKHTNNFVGRAGLRRLVIDDKEEVEVAYAFMPSYWGKGLATEIAKHCIAIGFRHYKLHNLVAGTQESNKASRRVIEKCGFNFEKEIMQFGALQAVYRKINKAPLNPPDKLAQQILATHKEKGRIWLDALPSLIEKIATTWNLNYLHPYDNLSWNYVVYGEQEHNPIVLKVGIDLALLSREVAALQAFSKKKML